jgi:hypothetical protein
VSAPTVSRRFPLLPFALEAAIAALLGAVVAAAHAGPLRLALGDATISVRTLTRPLVIAGVLAALRWWMDRGDLRVMPAIVGRVALGAIITASVLGWTIFLSPTVGGVDSYGYVSTAERLRNGSLVQHEALAAAMPFPGGIAAATPLGYVSGGRVPDTSVPLYPLGLPAVMALAQTIGARSGPFWVAPLMGLLLIGSTAALAHQWYGDRATGLVSAALVAANPLVFTYAIQPMSDVPAAACLTTAVAALVRRRPRSLAAGCAAALAILIRPALAPAAVVLVAIIMSRVRETDARSRFGRSRDRPLQMYMIPIAIAIGVQGWTQWYLYGDPLSAGYGRIASLFTWQTAVTNVGIFGRWTVPTFGIVWLAAVAFGLAVSERRPRLVLLAVATTVSLPYVFYRPYDHWETLRFLLPIVCVATPIAAAGLVAVARRLARAEAAVLIAAVMIATMSWGWTRWLGANQVFTMPAHEARHRLAGEMVAQTTPESAVIIALQHSGSLRYYSGRQTLNWSGIPSGAFDATVRVLRAQGLPVYVMIDSDAERALFVEQHGRVLDEGGWLPAGQRRSVQLLEAR